MALAGSILTGGTGNLINYNFSDVTRQTGYITYYLSNISSGAYFWSPEAFAAEKTFSTINVGAKTYNSWSDELPLTTDLTFNVPQNLKGDLILAVATRITGATNILYRISGAIYKYDGAVETKLGSTANSTIRDSGDADGVYHTLKINIPNLTHFNAGDILRIKEAFTVSGAMAAGKFFIFHDPLNVASGAANITAYKLSVPFKIDI